MRAANQRPTLALGTALLLLGLAGCSAAGRHKVANYPAPTDQVQARKPSAVEREFPVERAPAAGQPAPAAPRPDSDFSSSHPRVQSFVGQYQTSMRTYMQLALQRASKYLPRMARILAEEGVPPELAYLPIVESG